MLDDLIDLGEDGLTKNIVIGLCGERLRLTTGDLERLTGDLERLTGDLEYLLTGDLLGDLERLL